MKNKLYIVCLAIVFAAFGTMELYARGSKETTVSQAVKPETVLRSAPFSRGVNFSGWFEANSAHGINFTKYTEQDFADVKSLGADVIRLPVRLHDMTGGAPDYTLDPLFLRFLDCAVDWAEKYGLYIIIDNHSFDPVASTNTDIDRVLLPAWAQIAQRYKDRGDYVVYEILNEPHGISDSRWGEIQGMAIETIRRYDQKHAIIVGGTDFNSINKLAAIPSYSDPNLIYTFHFYDPFLFTHQGASWADPLTAQLSGIPFPYERRRMPRIPAKLRGTWIENNLNIDYPRDASPAKLTGSLDRVVSFSRERDVPVFCGEFGVYIPNSPPEDRVRWYEFVTNALDSRNIARTSWDYYGGFGIFNSDNGDFNSDLNTGVVRAMGFTHPVQIPRTGKPLDTGFVIFDDYPNRQYVTAGYWVDTANFNLYETNAAEGEFAIRWGNVSQYSTFWFDFYRNGDFSRLVSAGYYLEFKASMNTPASFDVRFLNNEKIPSLPWRMRYTIDENILPPDGRWHTIRIPLADMREHGAWVNSTQQWFSPREEFSWEKVRQLEFASEHMDIVGFILLDDIKITR